MNSGIEIVTGSWNELENLVSPVRRTVFIIEQQIPEEEEWDEYDAVALHTAALLPDSTPIGCGRLINDDNGQGRIGRMAVIKEYRHQSIASQLLQVVEREASRQGIREILLHAQCSISKLYERNDYRPFGDIFNEVGIPHIKMKKYI